MLRSDDIPDKIMKDWRRLLFDKFHGTRDFNMCEAAQYADVSSSGKRRARARRVREKLCVDGTRAFSGVKAVRFNDRPSSWYVE